MRKLALAARGAALVATAAVALTAGAAVAAPGAGIRVSLSAGGHTVVAGRPWSYAIVVRDTRGKPLRATALIGVRGNAQETRRFVGTFKRTLAWRNAGLFTFRVAVRANGLARTLDYPVTVAPPTGSAAPVPGTQQKPVAFGSIGVVTDSSTAPWDVSVGFVRRDATAAVRSASKVSRDPPSGRQYLTIYLTMTYEGTTQGNLRSLALQAYGRSGTTYTAERDGCGSRTPAPDLFLDSGVKPFAPGTTRAGSICFSVLTGDAASLVLFNYAGSGQSWLALR